MLTDIISKSVAEIQRKRSAQESKQSAETFANALAYLDTTSAQAKDALKCIDAMQTNGISKRPILKASTRDELLESANICGRGAYEGILTRDMVKVLESHIKTARAELETAWRGNAAAYSDGPKGYLSMIGGLTDDPKRAKELESNISAAVTGTPTTKQIQSLVSSVEEARNLASEFSLKPEIEAFLKKVSIQQATVSDLTPEVITWLSKKNLLTKLKIKF